jgi:hypothetical protein
MASMDARPRGSGALPPAMATNDPNDRLAAIARWVNARIEELHQSEARITTRLEHLARSEDSLKKLCDTLREQVLECQPVLADLKGAQPRAQAIAQEIALEARRQFEQVVAGQLPDADLIHQHIQRLNDAIAGQEQRILDAATQAEQRLTDRVRALDDDLAATCQTTSNFIEDATGTARHLADELLSNVRRSTNDFERLSGEVSLQITDRVNTAAARIEQEMQQQLAPIADRAQKLINDHREDIDAILAASELDLRKRVKGLDALLAEASSQLERRLTDATDEFRRLSGQAQANLMQSIREQIDAVEHETRVAIRPILLKIEEQRDATDAQVRAALDAAEDALR